MGVSRVRVADGRADPDGGCLRRRSRSAEVDLTGLVFCVVGAGCSLGAGSIELVWLGQVIAGVWATCLMAALAVGPLVAGVILDHVGWRWVFLLPAAAALVTMVVAARLVPESRAPGSRRLDRPGQVTAMLGITGLVYGVIEGGAGSFTDPPLEAGVQLLMVSAMPLLLGTPVGHLMHRVSARVLITGGLVVAMPD